MNIMLEILHNRAIVAAVLAWAIAQGLKVLLTLVISRKFDRSRMWGSGGMPSSHSAMVCARTTTVGIREGCASSMFAAAFAPAWCKTRWARR